MFNKSWMPKILLALMVLLSVVFTITIPLRQAFLTIFAFPFVAIMVYIVLEALPMIAVYKRNIERFYERFYGFKAFIILFILAVYLANILPWYGSTMDPNYILVPALSLLFFYLGHVFKHIHRNYFIGFMTPWALSSDKLWNRTHRFGGAVMEVCAVLLLVGLIFSQYFMLILGATVIAIIGIVAVYSYLIFSRKHHY